MDMAVSMLRAELSTARSPSAVLASGAVNPPFSPPPPPPPPPPPCHRDNLEVFRANGFDFADDPSTGRLLLATVPFRSPCSYSSALMTRPHLPILPLVAH